MKHHCQPFFHCTCGQQARRFKAALSRAFLLAITVAAIIVAAGYVGVLEKLWGGR